MRKKKRARVAKSVNAGDLKSPGFGRAGSSPAPGTMGLILGIGVHSASINRDPGPDVVVCKKFF